LPITRNDATAEFMLTVTYGLKYINLTFLMVLLCGKSSTIIMWSASNLLMSRCKCIHAVYWQLRGMSDCDSSLHSQTFYLYSRCVALHILYVSDRRSQLTVALEWSAIPLFTMLENTRYNIASCTNMLLRLCHCYMYSVYLD